MLPVLHTARADLAAGRAWKARDRLLGALPAHGADQELLGLLGEVFFAMGDHPQAGRFWALTERDDEAARVARAAFEERTGGLVARQLVVRAPLETYPPAVATRLRALGVQPRLPHGSPERAERRGTVGEPLPLGARAVLGALVTATLGPWLVGAARIARALWRR